MKDLLERVRVFHNVIYEKCLHGKQDLIKDSPSVEHICEVAFYFQEMAKLCKDLQVECDKLSGLAQKIACIKFMHSDPDKSTIECEDFFAEPDVKMSANIPSRTADPEGYAALLKWMGVPEELRNQGSLRVHWPEFKEILTERIKGGKPLPPGITPEKTHAHYHLKFKAKGVKDV